MENAMMNGEWTWIWQETGAYFRALVKALCYKEESCGVGIQWREWLLFI
jgi:hypothetical protein